MNISRLTDVAYAITGGGTVEDLNRAASPKGFFEYIVNFFTFGKVRRNNYEEIEKFAQTFSQELSKSWNGRGALPPHLTFELDEATIAFIIPEKNISNSDVIIRVLKNGELSQAGIEADIFRKICTVMWIRARYDLPYNVPPLTDEGRMNLRDIVAPGADFSDMDLNEADFSGSTLNDSDFEGAFLIRTRFHCVNLDRSSFKNSHCHFACFILCEMNESVFYYSKMIRVKIISCSLKQSDMSHAVAKGMKIFNSNAPDIILRKGDFDGIEIKETLFYGLNAYKSSLNFGTISHSKGDFSCLDKAEMKWLLIIDTSLANGSAEETTFTGSIFINDNLDGLNLRCADARHTFFKEVNFRNVNAAGARLSPNRMIDVETNHRTIQKSTMLIYKNIHNDEPKENKCVEINGRAFVTEN